MENDKIDKLEARITQLEKEVEQLKEGRKKSRIPPVEKVRRHQEPESDQQLVPPHLQQQEKKEPTDWETLIGKIWLPRIFIFVLLLGVVWGFKIAIDAGWLNEINRIIIGFIVAGLFYYLGDRQIKKDRIALGKVLLVGFIATLLVTTFAMHILYSMIPTSFAFILNVIWVALGIYLSHLHRSQAMGVMVAIAGYLIPFLVAGFGTSASLHMIILYELIYYLALLWFAIRNDYRILFYMSTILLHVVYFALLIVGARVLEPAHALLMTVGILMQHEVIFYTLIKGKIEKLNAFPLLFSSFLVTILWAKWGFAFYELAYLFTVYLIVTTIRYGWVAYQAKLKQNAKLLSIGTTLATLGILVLTLDLVENQYAMGSLLLIQGTLAVYVGYTFQSKMQKVIGYFIYYFTAFTVVTEYYIDGYERIILWGILIGTLYLHVIFNQRNKEETLFHVNVSIALLVHVLYLTNLDYYHLALGPLHWAVIIASLYVLYRLTKKDMTTLMRRVYLAINILIHLQFISYLAGELITESHNGQVLLTTAGWALYALAFVYLGMSRELKSFRMLGIGLIFFTLLKLIFFDLVFISLTTRSILFVFIGLIGILVSRFIYGKTK
ncbi:DUF2339 domain-containing protein [Oceanobacillus sp. CAU 1775]